MPPCGAASSLWAGTQCESTPRWEDFEGENWLAPSLTLCTMEPEGGWCQVKWLGGRTDVFVQRWKGLRYLKLASLADCLVLHPRDGWRTALYSSYWDILVTTEITQCVIVSRAHMSWFVESLVIKTWTSKLWKSSPNASTLKPCTSILQTSEPERFELVSASTSWPLYDNTDPFLKRPQAMGYN